MNALTMIFMYLPQICCDPILKGYRRCRNGLWQNAHDDYDYVDFIVKPRQKLENVKPKGTQIAVSS